LEKKLKRAIQHEFPILSFGDVAVLLDGVFGKVVLIVVLVVVLIDGRGRRKTTTMRVKNSVPSKTPSLQRRRRRHRFFDAAHVAKKLSRFIHKLSHRHQVRSFF
jgi:hypothetical protein